MKECLYLIAILTFWLCNDVHGQESHVTFDTLKHQDTLYIIQTACAPICSSVVHIYSTTGVFITRLYPPFKAVFAEAYIADDRLLWRDNTYMILDDEEKKED